MLLVVRHQSEWLWPPGLRESELMKTCCYNPSLVISVPQRAVWLWTNHSKGYTNSSTATKGSIFLEFLTGCGNSFVFLSSPYLVEYFFIYSTRSWWQLEKGSICISVFITSKSFSQFYFQGWRPCCQGHRQRQSHHSNNNYALHISGDLQLWKFLHVYCRGC